MNTIEQSITNEQNSIEAKRYRWLFGARTAEECASEDICYSGKPLPQDLVISELSSFYCHKELVDAMIDASMKENCKNT